MGMNILKINVLLVSKIFKEFETPSYHPIEIMLLVNASLTK